MSRLLPTLCFALLPSEILVILDHAEYNIDIKNCRCERVKEHSCLSLIFSFCSSLSQTRVAAVLVSMETAAALTSWRTWSHLMSVSAPMATRGRGVIRFSLTSWLPNWSCQTPPLQSQRPQPLPPPLPPLSQSLLSLPQHHHLPPCSHGNPNLGKCYKWYHGRQAR